MQSNDSTDLNVLYNKNLKDRDYVMSLGGNYQYSDNLSLCAQYYYFYGKDQTAFGLWRNNTNLELGVKYSY